MPADSPLPRTLDAATQPAVCRAYPENVITEVTACVVLMRVAVHGSIVLCPYSGGASL